MKLKTLDELKQKAIEIGPKKISVANPAEEDIFKALSAAHKAGIIHGFLVGIREKIEPFVRQFDLNPPDFEIIDAENEEKAAILAVKLVRDKKADFLMKGTVATATFLQAVLDKDVGLKKVGTLLSHVAIHDVPGFPRLLVVTDAGFNIKPNLEQKISIIKNAIKVAKVIGLDRPKVALVAAVEKLNPKIQSTVDADEITKRAREGAFPDAVVEGPFGLDNALDPHCAMVKGLKGEVAGQADILVVDDLDSGNILYKSMTILARSVVAAIVVGTKAPVILTSRADDDHSKLVSLALGALDAHYSY